MLWFLRDYALAAVLLRAATLAFQSLLIGGLVFCTLLVAPGTQPDRFRVMALRALRIAAVALALTQVCFVALDSAMLMGAGGIRFTNLFSAIYFLSGCIIVACTVGFLFASRHFTVPAKRVWLLFTLPLLAATVWTSHAASRLDHRAPLILLTGIHQLATAVWIGGMPFLWWLLRARASHESKNAAENAALRTLRRYSIASWISVVALIAAGVILAWMYTQSWSAVYGTAYGWMLVTKCILLAGLLAIAAVNFRLSRQGSLDLPQWLLRIARVSEVEIGIGFTIILAAASLTSQPPAVDLVQNRVTLPQIAARMSPQWPSFQSPPISQMPPVAPIAQAIHNYDASTEQTHGSVNDPAEQAWSEYNHHWAGIVVFIAGLLAMLSRWGRAKWARHWPLVFLGLAVFLFLRADPEAWPLGPRGFWASFYNPEDLEHRVYVLLILSFVAFEWGVQTGRLHSQKAALVFPAVCALGGALLLTHNHSLGNVQDELLIEISHIGIAVCAVFAGWSRWLELRLEGRGRRVAGVAWPIWLMLIGLILLSYREG